MVSHLPQLWEEEELEPILPHGMFHACRGFWEEPPTSQGRYPLGRRGSQAVSRALLDPQLSLKAPDEILEMKTGQTPMSWKYLMTALPQPPCDGLMELLCPPRAGHRNLTPMLSRSATRRGRRTPMFKHRFGPPLGRTGLGGLGVMAGCWAKALGMQASGARKDRLARTAPLAPWKAWNTCVPRHPPHSLHQCCNHITLQHTPLQAFSQPHPSSLLRNN